MPLDPNIILAGLRNQDDGQSMIQAFQAGQGIAARRQQMQAQQMQMDQQKRMLKDEEDTRNAYRMSMNPQTGEIDQGAFLSNLGRLGQGQLAEKYKTQWTEQRVKQTKEMADAQKADIELKRAQAEEVSRRAFSAIQAFNQGDVRSAQSIWTESGMPGGFDIQEAHKAFNMGVSTKDQMEAIMKQQGWAREDKKAAETPLTDIAKLNADLQKGRISPQEHAMAMKKATTHGAGVTVGLMAPQQGVDESGNPVFFQPSKGGGPAQIIPNVAPQEKFTKVPSGVISNFVENETLLSTIDDAREAVKKRPGAIGMANVMVPDVVRQRTDPEGATARALVAQVGSLKYKDLSGAAVTLSEDKRMAPYIPKLTDRPDVVQTKLAGLRAELEKKQQETSKAYSEGYKAPPQFGRYGQGGAPSSKPTFTLAQVKARAQATGQSTTEIIKAIEAKGGTVR